MSITDHDVENSLAEPVVFRQEPTPDPKIFHVYKRLLTKTPLFEFPPRCKFLRVDVGLSDDASQSVDWLADKELQDRAIIGIEAHPKNIKGLLTGVVKQPDGVAKADSLSLTYNRWSHQRKHHGTIDQRYLLINTAVDNVERLCLEKFYTAYPDRGNSSLIPSAIDIKSSQNTIQNYIDVPCISMTEIFSRVDWARFPFIEVLKIDTELKDLDVLKSCGEYLKKILLLRVEAFKECQPGHITDSNPTGWVNTADPITDYLKPKGFRLVAENPGDFRYVNEQLDP